MESKVDLSSTDNNWIKGKRFKFLIAKMNH